MRRWSIVLAAAALLGLASWVGISREPGPDPGDAPLFEEAFWRHWGDGRAELAGYDLRYVRYGETRRGSAVTIFVTEPFAGVARVKSEDARSAAGDVFQVLKLNLIQDFPTGVYDYNLMTSVFVTLEPVLGRPAGSSTKVSFSSQEWCGQTYAQLLFDERAVRYMSHSYFEGEADQERTLDHPRDGLAEDALPVWARGLAAPLLAPGESRDVRLLRSLERARLDHLPPAWDRATLSRGKETERVTVPAGTFVVRRAAVAVPGQPDRQWTFHVEEAAPHRLIRWSRGNGSGAELLASDRLSYWSMNGPEFTRALTRLGLRPRPSRTP